MQECGQRISTLVLESEVCPAGKRNCVKMRQQLCSVHSATAATTTTRIVATTTTTKATPRVACAFLMCVLARCLTACKLCQGGEETAAKTRCMHNDDSRKRVPAGEGGKRGCKAINELNGYLGQMQNYICCK